ncbi:MAG: LysM peptidoglycan-binding domain-containing protein [Bacteriovoracaceae bacterium]
MHSRKILKVLLLATLMMGSFACSMRSKKTLAKEAEAAAAAKEAEVAKNEEAAKLEGEEILADDLFQKPKQENATENNVAQNESVAPAVTEAPLEKHEEPAVVAEEKVAQPEEVKVDHTVMLEEKQYVVQKNETLMMVAFKLFGDYSKWRELSEKNNIKPNKKIVPGTIINYTQSGEGFVWTPRGNPYLIKLGQTLGLISTDVYGNNKQWKQIWDNNRPLIKNPNLIFAGFTIYYLPKDELASK